jgi:hypothetical protein
MADEDSSLPPGPAHRLTVEEIADLGRAGRLFHQVTGYRAKQDALDLALKAAERHRAEGAGWPDITRALRIPEEELRHRMRETAHKPLPPPPQRPSMGISDTSPHGVSGPMTGHRPAYQSRSANQESSSSASSHTSQDAFLTISHSAHDRDRAILAPDISRRVLFVSGDPRPGRNDFGSEAAYIRQALVGSYVQLTEMAAVGIAELCPALDQHRPTVLHIAAHSSFGGVHLAQDDGDLCIAYTAFCAEISRARYPPRLTVLNFCGSTVLSEEIAQTGATVISGPHDLRDGQARTFTQHFYRSLAGRRRSVGDSFQDAAAALNDPEQALLSPNLHGDTATRIF